MNSKKLTTKIARVQFSQRFWSGATMSVFSQDGENITVVLTTDAQVFEPEGVFREKHLSMTAPVPG
jgi:hypothetical protein